MNNKIAVITGSTRGFGFAIAEAMLKAGATVVISGRTGAGVKRALKSLEGFGPVSAEICDVRRESQVHALGRRVMKRFGRIDIWVNNAGYSASAGMILDSPPGHALDMFLANDMGALYGSRTALHYMMPRRDGTLVNIYGNGSFLRPASPTALYGATKAWMTSLTRSLATEVKGSGVKIIGFSPGMLLTDMLTAPTVCGEGGRAMMKNYGFVLRMLAGSPQNAANKLVGVLESNGKEFMECRLFRPWTPLLGVLRITWENLTKTGNTPKFKVKFERAYKPKF
jgi:NAD(P)-dependent dehydrogenase (short-subunit alcohol dehydrogenase family)